MIGYGRVLAAAAGLYAGPAAMAIPPLTRLLTRRSAGGNPSCVALTFDDGPHPEGTPAVMEVLADFGVTATFFLIAEQAERHASIVGRLVAGGHGVALHGYRHRLLIARSPAAVVTDIRRGHAILRRITGHPPRWYRPPYGTATWPALTTAHRLGMTPAWWTSEGRDWSAARSPAAIADRILRRDQHGRPRLDHRDILLLHDSDAYAAAGSWRATVTALPGILSAITAAGLTVGPLPEGRHLHRG